MGYTCFKLSDEGIPDLLCCKRGRLILVECKGAGQKLTPPQQRFFASARVLGFPCYVVRDLDDLKVMDAVEFSE